VDQNQRQRDWAKVGEPSRSDLDRSGGSNLTFFLPSGFGGLHFGLDGQLQALDLGFAFPAQHAQKDPSGEKASDSDQQRHGRIPLSLKVLSAGHGQGLSDKHYRPRTMVLAHFERPGGV
jgi:hypothetical protein